MKTCKICNEKLASITIGKGFEVCKKCRPKEVYFCEKCGKQKKSSKGVLCRSCACIESCKKYGHNMKGKHHSESSKKKMSLNHTKNPVSEETKRKMSLSHKIFFENEENKKRYKDSRIKGEKHHFYGKSLKENWINKYGEEEGKKKYEEHLNKNYRGENNPRYGIKGKNHPMFGKQPQWQKRYEYNNEKFRSSYEVERAKFLDSISANWKYETITYDLIDTTYTPDFFIYDNKNNLIRIEDVKCVYTYKIRKEKIDKFLRMYEKESKIFNILILENNENGEPYWKII